MSKNQPPIDQYGKVIDRFIATIKTINSIKHRNGFCYLTNLSIYTYTKSTQTKLGSDEIFLVQNEINSERLFLHLLPATCTTKMID